MNRLSGAAAAAVFALCLSPMAQGASDDAWITLDRNTAQQALIGFAAAGRPGALVIMDAGRPEALGTTAKDTDVVVARISVDDVEMLPGILHAARHRCGGFMRHDTREQAEWAAARANNPEQRTSRPPISFTIDNGPVVNAMLPRIQEPGIHKTIVSLGNFVNRKYQCTTGVTSANWIKSRWQAIAAGRPDITVDLYAHTGFPQPSVILTIPGSTLPTEVVILGAHQDSIAGSGCSAVAPGEDDDASGIASLTEVLKVALRMNYHPQRTVKFMAYAAEEGGLLGSEQIASAYDQQNVNVVGVMQLDMTNYKGSVGDIYIYQDYTNPCAEHVRRQPRDHLPARAHQGHHPGMRLRLLRPRVVALARLSGVAAVRGEVQPVRPVHPHEPGHDRELRQYRQPRGQVLEARGSLHGRGGQRRVHELSR
jgi:leucyl aminopeptidase